ncbi:MFS general substrate transporter [Stereum hirsutum FP-91666 SS1]|uniref:MFS general substrate transporter n=1 Tax=Stereum hirsutum (strain FP-91666) TaxID=721885 RepID=UPI000440EEF5|nr:MFS general substrate transporter [Stereum hirsutum FP-91666 SS1]EIM90953.1 MFS general substrate transporter [Stereum hirsutum FP-91666 SS1]
MSTPKSSTPYDSDEETPLLQHSASYSHDTDATIIETKNYTPLPKLQIGICLLIQFAEPITAQCILPFINQLVSELDITNGDERKVGYYVGIIESLFFAVEAVTVLQWSRLSDHIGRKPILLIGLIGLSISMFLFGLSRTFWTLVISRCLAGGLNGNIGVMKSTMAELTDETNIAQAFSLMPVVYSSGSTLASFMGGMLSRPHDHYPGIFGGTFWINFPYFLPCAVAASYSALSFVITAVFLKETLPKGKRAGSQDFVEDEPLSHPHKHQAISIRKLVTYKPVVLSVGNYGSLALIEMAFLAVLPLFYSTPTELGGLGFPPSTIGYCMGAFGIMNGVFQGLFFTKIIGRLGPRRLFMVSMGAFTPIYLLFPVINILALRRGMSFFVWALIGLQLCLTVIMDMAYGTCCVFIFITSAAPNQQSLGATNGLAQTVASIVRTIGPALSTSMFAMSIELNIMGGYGVYFIMAALSLSSLILAARLPPSAWKSNEAR